MLRILSIILFGTISFISAADRQAPLPLTMQDDNFVQASLRKIEEYSDTAVNAVCDCTELTLGCGCCEKQIENFLIHRCPPCPNTTQSFIAERCFTFLEDGGSAFPVFCIPLSTVCCVATCAKCPPPFWLVTLSTTTGLVSFKLLSHKFNQMKSDPIVQERIARARQEMCRNAEQRFQQEQDEQEFKQFKDRLEAQNEKALRMRFEALKAKNNRQ